MPHTYVISGFMRIFKNILTHTCTTKTTLWHGILDERTSHSQVLERKDVASTITSEQVQYRTCHLCHFYVFTKAQHTCKKTTNIPFGTKYLAKSPTRLVFPTVHFCISQFGSQQWLMKLHEYSCVLMCMSLRMYSISDILYVCACCIYLCVCVCVCIREYVCVCMYACMYIFHAMYPACEHNIF